MGMFDKLFGEAVKAINNAAEEIATDVAKDAIKKEFKEEIDAVQNAADRAAAAGHEEMRSTLSSEYVGSASGFSWGDDMPAEENQFNFGGDYRAYFEKIFAEDFAGFAVDKEIPSKFPSRTIYRLSSGGSAALVVELLPDTSSTKKLRRECEAAGTPYVRFYYDHDGWWNTREYVKSRINKALGR